MATQVKDWIEPPKPRPEASYRRPRPKIVRCKNEAAHLCASPEESISLRVQILADRYLVKSVSITSPEKDIFSTTRPLSDAVPVQNIETRFRRLASEWSDEVKYVSSVEVLTSHPKYQSIVQLGWDVVPFLLSDLRKSQGYWFAALNEITGIRPFDPNDAGNTKRMTEAWVKWGQRKGII